MRRTPKYNDDAVKNFVRRYLCGPYPKLLVLGRRQSSTKIVGIGAKMIYKTVTIHVEEGIQTS